MIILEIWNVYRILWILTLYILSNNILKIFSNLKLYMPIMNFYIFIINAGNFELLNLKM